MATALQNAVDRTVEAVEHGTNAGRNVVADVRAGDLQSDLASYKDEVLNAVSSAMSKAKTQGGRMLHKTGDAYDVARDHTVEAAESALQYVKAHPVTVVAVAAGVGALVALLMLRRH